MNWYTELAVVGKFQYVTMLLIEIHLHYLVFLTYSLAFTRVLERQ